MFPPIKTGTSNHTKNLVKAFYKSKTDISLITVKNNQAYNDTQFPYPIYRLKALHFNSKKYFKHLRIVSIFISNYIKSYIIIKRKSPDRIIIINHYLDLVFPIIISAKLLRIPIYISVGTQLQSPNIYKNKILNFLDKLICGKLVFPFVNKIVAWDNQIIKYLQDIHKSKKIRSKIIEIPFGAKDLYESNLKKKSNYALAHKIVGVGAIFDARDFIYIIKIFKKLLIEYPKLKLIIIGHEYTDKTRKYVESEGLSSKVNFLGEIEHNEVIKQLKEADIHCMMLSGKYVGIGTSNLESMLVGTPIVSNIPDNIFSSKRLLDMRDYIYTSGNDEEILIKKLKTVLDNEAVRKKIGESGQRFVEENLNWERVVEAYKTSFKNDKSNFKN